MIDIFLLGADSCLMEPFYEILNIFSFVTDFKRSIYSAFTRNLQILNIYIRIGIDINQQVSINITYYFSKNESQISPHATLSLTKKVLSRP